MADTQRLNLQALEARLDEVESYLHIAEKRQQLAHLEQLSGSPDFWSDTARAKETMTHMASLKDDIAGIDRARELYEDADAAFELAVELAREVGVPIQELFAQSEAGAASHAKASSVNAPAANPPVANAPLAHAQSARAQSACAQSAHTSPDPNTPLAHTTLPAGEFAEAKALAQEARSLANKLEHILSELELSSWFTNEFDHGDAIVTVTPGQGGLEAQDWTDMLFHMYLRYAEKRGWNVDINDAPAAEVIGIDRATFTVHGKNAYGMLRAEQGVHRLVRISPTDDKKRRQTTFAGVEVLPLLPDDVEVAIDPADLRIDVYHASGPGGQGVNTTDSAVRITHLPTNIVVTCQNERSQIQNKATALQILRSRLYELELKKREAALDELRGPKHEISFGNQIRSYVLYPYQMVKDLRSSVETGNVDAVLSEGDLDQFVVGYHRWVVATADVPAGGAAGSAAGSAAGGAAGSAASGAAGSAASATATSSAVGAAIADSTTGATSTTSKSATNASSNPPASSDR